MEELSGYDLSEVDPAASLLELGLDSLLLTQAAQVFQTKFGVSISFRQLMEELGSLKDIANILTPSCRRKHLPRQRRPLPRLQLHR